MQKADYSEEAPQFKTLNYDMPVFQDKPDHNQVELDNSSKKLHQYDMLQSLQKGNESYNNEDLLGTDRAANSLVPTLMPFDKNIPTPIKAPTAQQSQQALPPSDE